MQIMKFSVMKKMKPLWHNAIKILIPLRNKAIKILIPLRHYAIKFLKIFLPKKLKLNRLFKILKLTLIRQIQNSQQMIAIMKFLSRLKHFLNLLWNKRKRKIIKRKNNQDLNCIRNEELRFLINFKLNNKLIIFHKISNKLEVFFYNFEIRNLTKAV